MSSSLQCDLIISGLLAALEGDSINPKPDYSIDGQTVSRAQWRESILSEITNLQDLQQRFEPFELRGFML